MGSWNEVCAVSHINFGVGARIVLFLMDSKSTFAGESNHSGIVCPPIRGEYDDYGRILPDKDDKVVKFVEDYFKMPFDEIFEHISNAAYGHNQEMRKELEGIKYAFVLEEIYEWLGKKRDDDEDSYYNGDLMSRFNNVFFPLSRHSWIHSMYLDYIDLIDPKNTKRETPLQVIRRWDANPIPHVDEKVERLVKMRESGPFDSWWTEYCTLTDTFSRTLMPEEREYFNYKLECHRLWTYVYYEMFDNKNTYFVEEMMKVLHMNRMLWCINQKLHPYQGRVGSQCGEPEIHNEFLRLCIDVNTKLHDYGEEED